MTLDELGRICTTCPIIRTGSTASYYHETWGSA